MYIRPAHGFSLIEMMVASAIALIVATAATSLMASIVAQTAVDETTARTDRELKVLIDRLAFELRNSGGNGVSLRSAFLVTNKSGAGEVAFGNTRLAMPAATFTTAKAGSDRLTVLLSRYTLAPCAASSSNAGAATMTFPLDSTCCTTPAGWLTQSAALVDKTGEIAIPVIASTSSAGATSCTYTFSGQASRFAPIAGQTGLTLALTQPLTTFYIDGNSRLQRVVERWNGSTIVRVSSIFADNVVDLQFMLGFDLDGNGAIQSPNGTITAANDEWLFNATDTNNAALISATADLRMVALGIVQSSTKALSTTRTVSVFDGPATTSNLYLKAATARMTLRNYPVFE